VRFVFYWIAYEAAFQNYKNENREIPEIKDWEQREQLHERLAERDGAKLRTVLYAQRRDVIEILKLRQTHRPFWKKGGQGKYVRSPEEWERKFKNRVGLTIESLNKGKTCITLNNLFDNLAIVRQQIVHGGSAGLRSRGRTQVMLGAGLLKAFVPFFRDSIQSNIDEDWGKPPYPRVGSLEDEECPPPWLVLRENSG
ncbi:MAG: hypothetical protein OXU81_12855, partial [Gammaproteobacteria bacterium]|nr:hypothetical protein [Gammaproteobacteria bacterium]